MPQFNDIDEREAGAETASDAELLLVDLLYGELDGEDRARAEERAREDDALAGELEALSHIRALMRELPEEEPPDAVSAKILHAAAAQAPGQRATGADDEGSSLWARLRRLFLPMTMHPGLMAAASVLLVGGVAGMLYLSGGMQRADMAYEEPRALSEAARDQAAAGMAPEMETAAAPAGAPSERDEADQAGAEAIVGDRAAEGSPRGSARYRDREAVALGAEEQRQDLALDSDRAGAASGPGAARRDAEERKSKRAARLERRKAAAPARQRPADDGRAAYGRPEASSAPAAGIGGLSGGELGKAGSTPGGGGAGASSGAGRAGSPPPPRAQAEPRKRAPSAPAADRQEISRDFAEPPPAASDDAPSQPRAKESETPADRARALHDRARAAASRDDCKAVIELGRRIRELDPRYHRERFSRDEQVRACLAAQGKAAKKK